jgi:hypothetical protein
VMFDTSPTKGTDTQTAEPPQVRGGGRQRSQAPGAAFPKCSYPHHHDKSIMCTMHVWNARLDIVQSCYAACSGPANDLARGQYYELLPATRSRGYQLSARLPGDHSRWKKSTQMQTVDTDDRGMTTAGCSPRVAVGGVGGRLPTPCMWKHSTHYGLC